MAMRDEMSTFIHFWWEWKLQLFRKSVWHYESRTSFNPGSPLRGVYSKEMIYELLSAKLFIKSKPNWKKLECPQIRKLLIMCFWPVSPCWFHSNYTALSSVPQVGQAAAASTHLHLLFFCLRILFTEYLSIRVSEYLHSLQPYLIQVFLQMPPS